MKKTVRFMTSVAAVAVATAAIPFSAEASSNFEMRKKVVTLSGIMTSKDTNQMFRHPTSMPLIFASRPIMAG